MKFICKKNELVQALQIAGKAVASKTENPLISGIYIKAENNIIEMQATNFEIGIICKIEAEIEGSGTILIPGYYAQEIIRRMPGTTVEFSFDPSENKVNIKSNRSSFSILCMEADKYPKINPFLSTNKFSISDRVLRDLILNTTFACSNNEGRPVFTGCLLEVNEDIITMAATDSHRLAVKSSQLEQPVEKKRIVIPAKLLNDLQRFLASDLPRDVVISCDLRQISFEFENVYITSRLIEGQFPDYTRVIPPNFTTTITLNTEEIRSTLDRIALISRTSEYNVVIMDIADGLARISSDNPEIGMAEEIVPASIDGENIRLSLNAGFILDGLKNIKAKEFVLKVNTPNAPIAIKQLEDPDTTYVISSVRG